MTEKYPKRLIEVDLPIKRISAHARREKSIRHGHISTLHIWWARRPLAACRSVVCASLWPDPADAVCPPRFVDTARKLMRYWGERYLGKCSEDSYPRFNKIARTPACLDDGMGLRRALLDFIADFANWDNSTDPGYLAVARTLTVAAHDALEGNNIFTLPESIDIESLNDAIKDVPRPLLVDPFAGGGAIPLEALRCGADAFASDLNPVAVLLNKVVLEYIPRYGLRLAEEVEKWGKWIKEQAEKELSEFYPKDEDGATPIAYLWARTITCEGPGCGAEAPLMRSLWLAKKKTRSVAVQIVPRPDEKRCDFVIIKKENGKWVYQDHPDKICENPKFDGTVARGSATCPCCGFTTPVKSVRAQIKARRGGANDARLFIVVTTRPNQKGRFYRLPTKRDLGAVSRASRELERRKTAHTGKFSLVPKEPLPPQGTLGFRIQRYGMTEWGDLFNSRQLLVLTTLVRLTISSGDHIASHYDRQFADAVQAYLCFLVSKSSDFNSSLSRWANHMQKSVATFGRHALPMLWDWGEVCPLGSATGSYFVGMKWIVNAIKKTNGMECESDNVTTSMNSAVDHPLPDDIARMFFSDPPYYDAIPYADLSDYFFVWLKRSVPASVQENLFFSECSQKEGECVVDPSKGHDKDYFETNMLSAMTEGRRILSPGGVGSIVFAHKSTSGWESQIESMLRAGWIVTASWPIDTEKPNRIRALDSAALASSVHLVCRPREDKDGNVIEHIGDWRDVLSELPGRIAAWLPRLASEGVVGADAIFACLGPALEIFSRYSSVEKASGEVVPLREYLEQVWAEVARQALNMIFEDADASGFEEDARLTAMWLWTLRTEANGNGADEGKTTSLPGYTLEYDAARKIAQGLGCHLENLTHLVKIKGDKAMLLSAESRARYLFGKEEFRATVKRRKKKEGPVQQSLFSFFDLPGEQESAMKRAELDLPPAGKTGLDQLHQAMLLFTAGRGAALKRFLVDDGIGANPQFWTLAQALSALYPSHTNEKRWVDGVLARKKGLGL
ncbi:Adenine-specific DNA methylase [Candidatus Desulfarcum epimagneticum]|uniref:Adenine-specific DNA methylase n=1 Tax=uncultured Desulfobacteraceae bacterium TaxID=218296 RepID=A0A484HM42_9BACT|nr:Adenine-specific DNA methylase [uncultured Desulfobacteraceae bacterium]